MIRRIGPVTSAAATRNVDGVTVRRTDLIPAEQSGGIAVVATEPQLLETVGGTMAEGTFLNDATATVPTVVLGSEAAARLGITDLDGDPLVWIGGRWFRVIGHPRPRAARPRPRPVGARRLPGGPASCSASTSRRRPCGCAPTPTR